MIMSMSLATGEEVRREIRLGNWRRGTAGVACGYTQANVVILPVKYALDFFIFCQRNPKPCPILDVCQPGKFTPILTAPSADIRTDIPKYRVHRRGVMVEEVDDIVGLWSDDMVSFLLGCSLTFDKALSDAGIPMRHIEEGREGVPTYITNIECIPAGIFSGPLVVTMRPIAEELVEKAIAITSRFPKVHGAPIHIGDPAKIGIKDISRTDFGHAVTINKGEVPVFWACGNTTEVAVMNAKPELAITHVPGHMFITDIRSDDLASF